MSWYKEEWTEIIETVAAEEHRQTRKISSPGTATIKYEELFSDIPAMLKGIISSRFYESDYNNITKKLLYEDASYEETISKGIAKSRNGRWRMRECCKILNVLKYEIMK